MKPTDTPIVALGPALQVFRGLLFAVVLYPFRRVFLDEGRGWLKLWGLFMGLAILGTSGPAPGSFEGIVFLKAPVADQIIGLWEVVLQTLLASILVVAWHRKPGKPWAVVMYGLWALTVMMSVAGAVLPRPELLS
jgi:hypothetical protein